MKTQAEGNYVFQATPPIGPEQVKMTYPHCKALVTTGTENISTTNTHIICLALSLLGCILWAPCVYCNNDCKAVEHHCPNCYKYLGKYSP